MSDQSSVQSQELNILDQLNSLEPSKRTRVLRKIVAAAVGSIPWVGGFLAAMASFTDESGQMQVNALQRQWLEEHKRRLDQLGSELNALIFRLDSFGQSIADRLESDDYLAIIRKGFRIWDQADTEQKRAHVGRLLANAGATKLCDDDLVRLFLDWLELYHESHFQVIREIYQNPGVTRFEIWELIHGGFPREDSAEADLYRLLIRDLSTGGIIRQPRDTNERGQFLRKPRKRTPPGGQSATVESAFDDEKPYVLTNLGNQFVHYVFTEVVERIGEETRETDPSKS
jgi:hypothetical protein